MIGLCAACVGGLLNLSRLAADVGVATATINSWLSILQSSYLVFLLQPYAGNMRKRLTKAPKLYFYDTGLLCHLLGIHDEHSLMNHPLSGEIFENLVVSERQKAYLNRGIEPTLAFYRDDSKREIDLIDLTEPARPQAFEIKSGATYRDSIRSTPTLRWFRTWHSRKGPTSYITAPRATIPRAHRLCRQKSSCFGSRSERRGNRPRLDLCSLEARKAEASRPCSLAHPYAGAKVCQRTLVTLGLRASQISRPKVIH